MTSSAVSARPMIALHGVGCDFDVSKPWLTRVIERAPRQLLQAVNDVSLNVRRGDLVPGQPGFGMPVRCPNYNGATKKCTRYDHMGIER